MNGQIKDALISCFSYVSLFVTTPGNSLFICCFEVFDLRCESNELIRSHLTLLSSWSAALHKSNWYSDCDLMIYASTIGSVLRNSPYSVFACNSFLVLITVNFFFFQPLEFRPELHPHGLRGKKPFAVFLLNVSFFIFETENSEIETVTLYHCILPVLTPSWDKQQQWQMVACDCDIQAKGNEKKM